MKSGHFFKATLLLLPIICLSLFLSLCEQLATPGAFTQAFLLFLLRNIFWTPRMARSASAAQLSAHIASWSWFCVHGCSLTFTFRQACLVDIAKLSTLQQLRRKTADAVTCSLVFCYFLLQTICLQTTENTHACQRGLACIRLTTVFPNAFSFAVSLFPAGVFLAFATHTCCATCLLLIYSCSGTFTNVS